MDENNKVDSNNIIVKQPEPKAETPNQTGPTETTANVETPAPTTPTPESSKKTVEVDADVLKRLVDGYEGMKKQVEDLTKAADVGRLSRIQQMRNEGKIVKAAKLSLYQEKIVLGWVKVKDDVFFDEQGRFHEDQQISLFLDDGFDEKGVRKSIQTEAMSYRAFSRLATKVEGEVISEKKDRDGVVFYTVRLDDGREYELPINYIN